MPAAAQGIRTVAAGDEPIPVATQVRHTTTIVVPPAETIVDVVAGDAEYWDVSAAANVAYVKPLEPDAASNVTLVAETAEGIRTWWSMSSTPGGRAREQARRHAPAFVAGVELAAHRAEEAAARAELRAIEAAAAWSAWLAQHSSSAPASSCGRGWRSSSWCGTGRRRRWTGAAWTWRGSCAWRSCWRSRRACCSSTTRRSRASA